MKFLKTNTYTHMHIRMHTHSHTHTCMNTKIKSHTHTQQNWQKMILCMLMHSLRMKILNFCQSFPHQPFPLNVSPMKSMINSSKICLLKFCIYFIRQSISLLNNYTISNYLSLHAAIDYNYTVFGTVDIFSTKII